MEESVLIKKAKSQIESVKGKTLSLEERKDRAITLASLMLEEAQRIQTPAEKKLQAQLAGMMHDPIGKVFTTTMTDQCFRSQRNQRIADQLAYVIKSLGVPNYLPPSKKLSLQGLAAFGKTLSSIAVPLTIHMIRKETSSVILPGEEKLLTEHMNKRRKEGVRINLNHLGEAILGEEEALRRLQIYLDDLAKPEVEYISVKISTIYSQINLLAWEETLFVLADRLRQLYRAAMKYRYQRPDGISVPKFVNLDMEEYRDLQLTVALFRKVLDEAEFYQHEAGIVLQSYLPDSFLIQQELTLWAMQRLAQGGAPIKIRIVKGANLAMEQWESALRLWPQAPYTSKADVDANFKRMVAYGSQKEHAKAAHLGIGSHNLFDIAYAMLVRAENNVEKDVCFEMLEGMADHMRRVVQQLSGDMLLYCPAATKEEFQNAVAYLVRRLDENTAPENFLRHAFDLRPGTPAWDQQVQLFSNACFASNQVYYLPRRTQNRLTENISNYSSRCFDNEPDTDWSLPQNRRWAEHILKEWKSKNHPPVPLVIGGEVKTSPGKVGVGEDPSYPNQPLYHYSLATEEQVDQTIETAKKSEIKWSQTPLQERMRLLGNIAHELRRHRGDLIGVMVADTGKTVPEADVEISEAIDFADYYRTNIEEWHHVPDIEWKSKGTILVAPPWNFPCSIPAGGILAALAAGNCVIFKPATESILVGWQLAQLFWKAGISREVLQFITCEDEPVGSRLVKDPRISAIVLTGATATAKLFLNMRPGLDLMAETGGKNVMVITGMSDRDLVIKDLISSAFGHSGQKCSACSLAILEAEVYDDAHFLQQLRDAAASLAVGSPWDLKTKVNPLIRAPNPTLMKGLTQLEPGETWLLEPKQDPDNPNLWSPGIKLGVKPSSFTFQNELFGPVLGLVRAESFEQALNWMNQTPYGLTAGIQSLDEREQNAWLSRVEAGNCYVNRTITGAIVERQPFGGCKDSSFGKGAKAGGPNYLVQFMQAKQIDLPNERASLNIQTKALSQSVEKTPAFASQLDLWKASAGSYAFYWNEYFSKAHDPSMVMGQDNLQCYKPHPHIILRGQKGDSPLDLLRIMAAALTCQADLQISLEDEAIAKQFQEMGLFTLLPIRHETDEAFIQRLSEGKIKRVRLLRQPTAPVQSALAQAGCHLNVGEVMANGRLELLHLLREVSISRDYHRYGNLGIREKEIRRPLPGSPEEMQFSDCEACACQ
jgi:RHH-type proline utilization regulon transcriptional repressor/proline dehydrogenase/delta 1-pyrroline-5-carboxylate dehydrogenase